jgi:hypothetical protein
MHVTKLTPRLLLAGWLLVLGWFASVPGVLPGAFAAAAWLDGEHGVELRADPEATTIVLTHGAPNAGKCHAQIHRHSAFARLLTSCATPAGQGADHVVKFAAASPGQAERKVEIAPSSDESAVASPAPAVAAVLIYPPSDRAVEYRASVRTHARIPKLPALRPALLI